MSQNRGYPQPHRSRLRTKLHPRCKSHPVSRAIRSPTLADTMSTASTERTRRRPLNLGGWAATTAVCVASLGAQLLGILHALERALGPSSEELRLALCATVLACWLIQISAVQRIRKLWRYRRYGTAIGTGVGLLVAALIGVVALVNAHLAVTDVAPWPSVAGPINGDLFHALSFAVATMVLTVFVQPVFVGMADKPDPVRNRDGQTGPRIGPNGHHQAESLWRPPQVMSLANSAPRIRRRQMVSGDRDRHKSFISAIWPKRATPRHPTACRPLFKTRLPIIICGRRRHEMRDATSGHKPLVPLACMTRGSPGSNDPATVEHPISFEPYAWPGSEQDHGPLLHARSPARGAVAVSGASDQ